MSGHESIGLQHRVRCPGRTEFAPLPYPQPAMPQARAPAQARWNGDSLSSTKWHPDSSAEARHHATTRDEDMHVRTHVTAPNPDLLPRGALAHCVCSANVR